MKAERSDAGGDARTMGTRSWIGSWPVYRQLTGTDRLGLGAAATMTAQGRRNELVPAAVVRYSHMSCGARYCG